MTGAAHGWSFLVARGRRRGYRTVLAPEFLTERGLHGVLSESASGEDLPPGRARTLELGHDQVGPMTVSYQTEQLVSADLNGRSADHGPPTDEHGRPLEILYGVVTRGQQGAALDGEDWRAVRTEALESYRRFLDQEDDWDVAASRSFGLHGVTAAPARAAAEPHRAGTAAASRVAVDDRPAPPPRHATRQRRGSMGGLALVALATAMACALIWHARSQPSHVAIAKASVEPSSGVVDCGGGSALRLNATIKSDGPAKVAYHWERDGRPVTSPVTVRFAGEGRMHVSSDSLTPPAAAAEGRFVFVVETPQVVRLEAPYDLRCRAAQAPADIGLK